MPKLSKAALEAENSKTEAEEIYDPLGALPVAEGGDVAVWRLAPVPSNVDNKGMYLGTLSWPFVLDDIRGKFGGGTFRLIAIKAGHNKLQVTRSFTIDGTPKRTELEEFEEPTELATETPSELMAVMLQLLKRRDVQPKAIDWNAIILTGVGAITALKELGLVGNRQDLAVEISKAYRQGREDAAGHSPTITDVISEHAGKVLNMFETQAALRTQQLPNRIPVKAVPAATVSPAAPNPGETEVEPPQNPDLPAWGDKLIDELARATRDPENFDDPDYIAAWIERNLPPHYLRSFLEADLSVAVSQIMSFEALVASRGGHLSADYAGKIISAVHATEVSALEVVPDQEPKRVDSEVS